MSSEAVESNTPDAGTQQSIKNIHDLLKGGVPLQDVAGTIVEGAFLGHEIEHKDAFDRFIDYIVYKARTGVPHIDNLAYPTMRIEDPEIEEKCTALLNEYLVPEIVINILKYFSRNVQQSDTNLYLAHMITSDTIIKSILETFQAFKKDVQNPDRDRKTLNVKRLQQFSSHTDNRFSSPLDAAARFKYILEYLSISRSVEHLYTADDIRMSP